MPSAEDRFAIAELLNRMAYYYDEDQLDDLDEDPGLGLVLSQDAAFLPSVQEGMRSKAFKGQLWGEQEQRLRHFHVELERWLNR